MDADSNPTPLPPDEQSVPMTGSDANSEPAEVFKYGADQIQALKGIEGIRHRPAMYIGDTATKGLHHLVYEVVDNSIDEAVAGFGKLIRVRLHADGSVSVSDEGRGIPVDPMPDEGNRPAVEVVLTHIHAGGKFDREGGYRMGTGGLHGVGIKAVNALSEWLQVEVRRDGHAWTIEFARGVVSAPLQRLGALKDPKKTGSTITFKPDPQIFAETKYNYDMLQRRMQELAFLNPGIRIQISEELSEKRDDFYYEGGIVEFVKWMNQTENALFPDIITIGGEGKTTVDDRELPITVRIALQYTDGVNENVRSFANNINTHEGGTHLSGFRSGLTRAVNNYGKKADLFKDYVPSGDDFREGLTAVITVNHPNPQFEGQTKAKLGNSEVEGIVSSIVLEQITKFLEEHPAVAKRICQKATLAAEAREAARKARELVQRKSGLTSGGLPEKLRDCRTHELDISELFLVEGQSAGGSADTGRNSDTQAILPLRGKIINVEKAQLVKALENEEVIAIFRAVGVTPGGEMDAAKRRYGKVIIMTDADVDGSHIRTLLLTFMFRHLRPLVEQGCIYIAQPPLYRVTQKKNVRYVQTEPSMMAQLIDLGLHGSALHVPEGPPFDGEVLQKIVGLLLELVEPLHTLEVRGIDLRVLHAHHLSDRRLLPRFRVFLGRAQHWFFDKASKDAFLLSQEAELGKELSVADAAAAPVVAVPVVAGETENVAETTVQVVDLHEVAKINQILLTLQGYGLELRDLIPAGMKNGVQVYPFKVTRDGETTPLVSLRDLPTALRNFGEKGMSVTRFKGLGEMNAEELGTTTMDPKFRTLLQVTMSDAVAADEIFRILMGDHVEPRRAFIEKHALDVKDLDV